LQNIHQILTKFWGFSEFRSLQEDIIKSVIAGKDTLALLPTGGGKSVCFQVPALAMDGVCIVISPLIALMKDQVGTLRKKGIAAETLYAGLRGDAIDRILDNCIYGNVKLLYLSPERLFAELVIERIKKMNVNLFAIDEAHCISQWGYDFRPSYLRIAEIRSIQPTVPVLALTATATKTVVKDIQEKLNFKEGIVFKKSFERKNLAYVVINEDDKPKKLLKIAKSVQGSGIIYARSRKGTKDLADFLNKNGIVSDFYHAGLDHQIRDVKQEAWKNDKCKVMVATNAFGMGIDKSNVRFVIHLETPDSLEAYFQEAGRAGRDGMKAYAVLLYNDADKINAKHYIAVNYPKDEVIKAVYEAMGNYFRLAIGAGESVAFSFDISEFSKSYKFKPREIISSIKFLEKEGYITATDALSNPSTLKFIIGKGDLYNFQVENRALDPFIKLLLRSYGGLFDNYIKINESDLAKRSNSTIKEVTNLLEKLVERNIIKYIPQNKTPQIIFTQGRIENKYLRLSEGNYAQLKIKAIERSESVIDYASQISKCRSKFLLNYFGETETYRCGICDICLERNKIKLSDLEFDSILEIIKPVLMKEEKTLEELVDLISTAPEEKTLKVVQWLLDAEKLCYNKEGKLVWGIK